MFRFVRLVAGVLAALTLAAAPVYAQSDVRSPLPAPVKVKQGMTNVPALSPLWLLPDYAAKYNVQIEMVMFQRFADARTALASGDLDITAFGPQDISLALGQGAKSMVGVAGVGSGNDCLIVRKGDDVKDWSALKGKAVLPLARVTRSPIEQITASTHAFCKGIAFSCKRWRLRLLLFLDTVLT